MTASLPVPAGQAARPWQTRALDELTDLLPRHTRILVQAATGGGKGTLIAGLAVLLARQGERVLFVVHRRVLLDDIEARVRAVAGDLTVGVVCGARRSRPARREWEAEIVLASRDALREERRAEMGTFTTVLLDEAHHAGAASYQAIWAAVTEENPEARLIGFTATPYESAPGGKVRPVMGRYFDAATAPYTIRDGIEAGDLVRPDARGVAWDLDFGDVKRRGDDYDMVDASKLVDRAEYNGHVVAKYLEHVPGQQALVYCCSVQHARDMAAAFMEKGVCAEAAWGSSKENPIREDELEARLDRYRAGETQALCSADLLLEGFDAPATAAILKARPTMSQIVFTQMVGRGLRTVGVPSSAATPEERRAAIAGSVKPTCLVLDFAPGRFVLDEVIEAERALIMAGREPRDERDPIEKEHGLVRVKGIAEYAMYVVPPVGEEMTGWLHYKGTFSKTFREEGKEGLLTVLVLPAEDEDGWEVWEVPVPRGGPRPLMGSPAAAAILDARIHRDLLANGPSMAIDIAFRLGLAKSLTVHAVGRLTERGVLARETLFRTGNTSSHTYRVHQERLAARVGRHHGVVTAIRMAECGRAGMAADHPKSFGGSALVTVEAARTTGGEAVARIGAAPRASRRSDAYPRARASAESLLHDEPGETGSTYRERLQCLFPELGKHSIMQIFTQAVRSGFRVQRQGASRRYFPIAQDADIIEGPTRSRR